MGCVQECKNIALLEKKFFLAREKRESAYCLQNASLKDREISFGELMKALFLY